jgi:ParB family chromosome partitioning protein
MSKTNAFAGMGDMLVAGFDATLMEDGAQRQMFKLADIEIDPQVREEFEDAENTLADLGDSLKEGQIQPILLRKGRVLPYRLVVGGRRCAAADLKGITELWGDYRPDMSDEEADRIQFAENVQRKNLTQIEVAKRIQRDLDQLGTVEAVLAKHKKSRAWLSKILSLLNLPGQTLRLVAENISADLEVINAVKVIEKVDAAKAGALVDDLKESRGKEDARKKVAQVKAQVKPKAEKAPKENAATARDTAHAEPGPVTATNFADAKTSGEDETKAEEGAPAAPRRDTPFDPTAILTNAFGLIFEHGSSPKVFMETLSAEDRADVTQWLETFFYAGRNCKNLSKAVIQGLRNGTFANDGVGAFAMMAFLQGADVEVETFNAIEVLGLVKA